MHACWPHTLDAARHPTGVVPTVERCPRHAKRSAHATFSLDTLLLLVLLAAVCLGIWREAPVLGVALALCSPPAWMIASRQIRCRQVAGGRVSAIRKIKYFIAAVASILSVIVGGVTVFASTCLGAVMLAIAAGIPGGGELVLFLGLPAALFLGAWTSLRMAQWLLSVVDGTPDADQRKAGNVSSRAALRFIVHPGINNHSGAIAESCCFLPFGGFFPRLSRHR